jgi:cob(I)alamin adenosyltransferase
MAKIYTRTGDTGETSLLGGRRVRKDDVRIEAIGAVDETNASIGLVRAELSRSQPPIEAMDELLAAIQHRLFDLGAELAAGAGSTKRRISSNDVRALEQSIDEWEEKLKPLTEFILPGGSAMAAQLHLARCVCRRAERRMVELRSSGESVGADTFGYMNRLSDLLFVLARAANAAAGVPDVVWERKGCDE